MSQRKSAAGLLVLALGLILEQNARAICAAPAEEGRWRNLTNTGEPSLIDVRMLGCNDQGENGRIRYTMRAWVRQSSGQFYGRPTVDAEYRTWNAKRWMYGRIPTGGNVATPPPSRRIRPGGTGALCNSQLPWSPSPATDRRRGSLVKHPP